MWERLWPRLSRLKPLPQIVKQLLIHYLVPSDDPNDVVQGEVYLLQQANDALPPLDQYEEFGSEFPEPNEYLRQKQVVLLENGRAVTAWVYVSTIMR
jgi:hypothetical protein